MRTQGTHCPFTSIVKKSEKRLSSNCKKVSKINLRIISKPHAHLQSLVKTSVNFQKNRNKTVGGVAHTTYPLSIHFHYQNAWKMTKFKLQRKVSKINPRIISKAHAYLLSIIKTSVKFQKNLNKTVGIVKIPEKRLSLNCEKKCQKLIWGLYYQSMAKTHTPKGDGRTDGRTEWRNAKKYVPPLFFEKAGDNMLTTRNSLFFPQTKNTLKYMEFSESGEYLLYNYEL